MLYKTISVRLAACVLLALACSCAWAADVSLEQARTAVGNWARLTAKPLGARIGQTVRDARTYRGADGDALFHVVRFKEGGFAVAAADDGILPVIAFSDDDDLVADDRNPLWVMLNRDLPQRRAFARKMAGQRLVLGAQAPTGEFAAKWQNLVASDSSYTVLGTGVSSVSDLRVSPLLTTTWSQQTAYGGACYNYYVPPYAAGSTANYPCGCVATAGAQLMRFHQYPTASVSASSYTIWVDGVASNATMIGGTYDWSSMATNPASSSTTLANRQAIGKLIYDVGVACYMSYTSTGSGAYDPNFVDALKNRFNYANAIVMLNQNTGVESSLTNAALANLDAKYPVLFGISGDGGHEVVGDGYGYIDRTLYVHLNMGWTGSYNAWYNLPSVTAYYSFTMLDSIVYNVFPSSSGEVISGRVLDGSGLAVSGATVVATNQSTSAGVSAVVTDANGVYALLVPEPTAHGPQTATATYTITASLSGRKATASATVKASKSTSYTYYPSTGGMSYTVGSGKVGNSWGNDLTLPDPLPAAPTGVSAGDGASTASVAVSWTSASYATGYKVYRYTSSASNSASVVGSVASTSFSDTTATPGALYYYWVKATNTTGSSAFSAYDTGVRLAPYTVTTEVPVPFAWLDAYGLVTGGDYEAAALADTDGDGYAAWQEYVAGTVPTNANSIFLAFIAFSNNAPVITWSPDLGTTRVYTVEGKSSLADASWLVPTNAASRFFRIDVSPK